MGRPSLTSLLEREVVVDERIKRALVDVERDWPPDLVELGIRADRARLLEHAAIVEPFGPRLLDVGGGYSPFGVLCARLGMQVCVADSYELEFFQRRDLPQLVESHGVECSRVDVVRDRLPYEDSSFDAVTSFDSLEHWHHSPRGLFGEIRRVLRPGGLLLLGVPNAVNARKRLAVLVGKTNWSRFEDWYFPRDFAGHVREPTLSDLERMAPDLGLKRWTTFGRNWQGYYGGPWQRRLARLADRPLRIRPTLCADIYLVGRRGA